MKKLCGILLIVTALLISGCEKTAKDIKHIQSNWFGLNRVITLYSDTGTVIKQYTVSARVEIDGATVSFLTDKGKEVKLSGTIVIEEQ